MSVMKTCCFRKKYNKIIFLPNSVRLAKDKIKPGQTGSDMALLFS